MRFRLLATALLIGPLCMTSHVSLAAPDCSSGLDCYTKALERLQAAQDALAKSAQNIVSLQSQIDELKTSQVSLPIGTIIAFDGTLESAAALQKSGWWVADGRTVTDSEAKTFVNRTTPNLVGRFLVGSTTAESTGGATRIHIPDLPTLVYTIPDWDKNTAHDRRGPASITIHPEGWLTGPAVMSRGIASGTDIDLPTPPSMSVIFLIKVK